MKALSALLALALAIFAYFHLHRPINYPAGVLIASEPQQIAISDATAPLEHGEYHLKPLARFSIDARILHRKRYGYDRQAKLVPVDLAVGWGPMSDQAVLDRIKISQSMRFYWYEYVAAADSKGPNRFAQHQSACYSGDKGSELILQITPARRSRASRGRAGGGDRPGDRFLAQLAQPDRHR